MVNKQCALPVAWAWLLNRLFDQRDNFGVSDIRVCTTYYVPYCILCRFIKLFLLQSSAERLFMNHGDNFRFPACRRCRKPNISTTKGQNCILPSKLSSTVYLDCMAGWRPCMTMTCDLSIMHLRSRGNQGSSMEKFA